MSEPIWDRGENWSEERWNEERRKSIIDDCQLILQRGSVTEDECEELARRYYALEGNIVGGSLHCVLDDGNHERESLEASIQDAANDGDQAGDLLGRVLLLLDDETRRQWLCPGDDDPRLLLAKAIVLDVDMIREEFGLPKKDKA